jgi:putative endonuclease
MKTLMPLPFCMYMLFSRKDFLLYTGYTGDLAKRITTHNEGVCISTRNRPPLDLVFAEFYLFAADARKREGYFKTTMGKKAIKLMFRNTLAKMGYRGTLEHLPIEQDPLDIE